MGFKSSVKVMKIQNCQCMMLLQMWQAIAKVQPTTEVTGIETENIQWENKVRHFPKYLQFKSTVGLK